MTLTYYPDTDTLDVLLSMGEGQDTNDKRDAVAGARVLVREKTSEFDGVQTVTHEADPSGQTLAHFREGGLEELTIEHATRRAPAGWAIESLRQEAAEVAAATNRIVESVTYNLVADRSSFETGEAGAHSPHTSDAAVQEFNQMIDDVEKTSTAA